MIPLTVKRHHQVRMITFLRAGGQGSQAIVNLLPKMYLKYTSLKLNSNIAPEHSNGWKMKHIYIQICSAKGKMFDEIQGMVGSDDSSGKKRARPQHGSSTYILYTLDFVS